MLTYSVQFYLFPCDYYSRQWRAIDMTPLGRWEHLSSTQEQKICLGVKFFGGIFRGRPADVPTQKLSPHRSERRKIKFVCADILDPKARTSMTRGGLRKTSCRKTSGWLFVHYQQLGPRYSPIAWTFFRSRQRSREGVVRRIRSTKPDFGQSIFFSALYSLQTLESGVGDQNLQFHLDRWLIDSGMGVLGPFACVHCV